MIKHLLILCVLIGLAFSSTNDVKTYILPKGAKVIYPSGEIFTVERSMWLLDYKYGIGLRRDAELWVKNEPIFTTKIENRDNQILNLQKQLTNRIQFGNNLEMINNYNLDYMKTTHEIFGKPEKQATRGNGMFAFGMVAGIGLTLLTGFVVGYAYKKMGE